MKAIPTQTLTNLKRIETLCAEKVASVHGSLTEADVLCLVRLRKKTGLQYDATNGRFRPLAIDD